MGPDGALFGQLTRIFVETVRAFYARRAAREGALSAQTGTVTVAQRTSSELRLNPHLHLVALDGAWHEPERCGRPPCALRKRAGGHANRPRITHALGSDWLVIAAVAFAMQMGVSDVIIGLTIVAAGTSMPEVATSITAAIKGERDIAVGNVVGSNTFNILGCLGLTGIVAASGVPVAPSILNFDLWAMLAVSVVCLPIFISGSDIARWEGAVFVLYYAAYTAYLILAAQQHDALPAFSRAMLLFVIPLTVVALVAVFLRHRRASV